MSYLTEEEAKIDDVPAVQIALELESETEMSEEECTSPKPKDVNTVNEKKTADFVSQDIEESSLPNESNISKEPKKEILLKTISTVYEDLQKTEEEIESLNKNLFTYINKMIDTQKSLVLKDSKSPDTQKSLVLKDSKSSAKDEASKSSCIGETLNKSSSDRIETNDREIDIQMNSNSQYYIPVIDSSDSCSQRDKSGTDVSKNFEGCNIEEVTALSHASDLHTRSVNHDNLTSVVVHSRSDDRNVRADVRTVFMRAGSNTSNSPLPNYTNSTYPSCSGNMQSYTVTESHSESNRSAVLNSEDSFTNWEQYSKFVDRSHYSPEYYTRTPQIYGSTREGRYYSQNTNNMPDEMAHHYGNVGYNNVCSDRNEEKFKQSIVDRSSPINNNDPPERQEIDGKADHSSKRERILDRSEELVQDSVAQNIIKRYHEYKRNITDKGQESNIFEPNVVGSNQEDSNEGESKPEVVKDPCGSLSRSKFTYGEYRRNLKAKTLGQTSDSTSVKDSVSASSVTVTPDQDHVKQPYFSSNIGRSQYNTYVDSERYTRFDRNRNDDSRFTYSPNPRFERQSPVNTDIVSSEDEMEDTSFDDSTCNVFTELRSVLDSADTKEVMPWYLPKQNISVADDKKERKSSRDKHDSSHSIERKEKESNVSDLTCDISRSNKQNESLLKSSSQKTDSSKACEQKESRSSTSAQKLAFDKIHDRKDTKSSSSGPKIDSSKFYERKEPKGNNSDKAWDPTKSRYGQRPGKEGLPVLGERSFNPFSPFSPTLSADKHRLEKSEKQEMVESASKQSAVKERDPAEILSAILANRQKDKDRGKKRHLTKSSSKHDILQKGKVSAETSKKESSVSKKEKSAVISEPVVSSTNDFINIDSSLKDKNISQPEQIELPDSSTNLIETPAVEKEHEDVGESTPCDLPRSRESQDIDDSDTKDCLKTSSPADTEGYSSLSKPNLSTGLSCESEQEVVDTDTIKMSVLNDKRICKVKLVDVFWKAKRDGKYKKKRINRLIEKVVKKCLRLEKFKFRLSGEKNKNPEISELRPKVPSKFDEAQGKIEELDIERNNIASLGEEHELSTAGIGNTKKRKRLISDENDVDVMNEESTQVLLESTVPDSLPDDSKQETKEESFFSDNKLMRPVTPETRDSAIEMEKTDCELNQQFKGTSESTSGNLLESNASVTGVCEPEANGKISSLDKDNKDSDKIDVKRSEDKVTVTGSVPVPIDEIPKESTVISSIKEENTKVLEGQLLKLPEIVEDDPALLYGNSNKKRVQPVITNLGTAETDSGVEPRSEENVKDSQHNTTLKSIADDSIVQSENSAINPICRDASDSSEPLPIIENVTNEINNSLLEIDRARNTLIKASSDSSGEEEEEVPFLKNLDSFLNELSEIIKIGENVSSACDSSGEFSNVEEGGKSEVEGNSVRDDAIELNAVNSLSIKKTNVPATINESPDDKEKISVSNELQTSTSCLKQVEAVLACVSLTEVSDAQTDNNFKDEFERSENNAEEGNTTGISSNNERNTLNVEEGNSLDLQERSFSPLINNEFTKLPACQIAQPAIFPLSGKIPRLEENRDFKVETGSSVRNSDEINLIDSSSITSQNIALSVNESLFLTKEKDSSVLSDESLLKPLGSEIDKTEVDDLNVTKNCMENSESLLDKSQTELVIEGNSYNQILEKSIGTTEEQEKLKYQNTDKNTAEILGDIFNEENASSCQVPERKIKIEKPLTDKTGNYSGIKSLKPEKHSKKSKGKVKPDKSTADVDISKKESKDMITGNVNVIFSIEEKGTIDTQEMEKVVKKTKKEKEQGDSDKTKSKKRAKSEKKLISGSKQIHEPQKTTVKNTENPKCEPVELITEDRSQLKDRLGAAERSNTSSIDSETTRDDCSLFVDRGHKRTHSVSNDDGLKDDSKKKMRKSSSGVRKGKNYDKISDKKLKIVDETENTRCSDKRSDSNVTDDISKDKKTKNQRRPDENPAAGDQGFDESRTSHSVVSERKCLYDVENKDDPNKGVPSKHNPEKAVDIYKEESQNPITGNENVRFSSEENRCADTQEIGKSAKKTKKEKEQRDSSIGKSKMYDKSDKKTISGDKQKSKPTEIIAKKTEKPKCETVVELCTKDRSKVLDSTKSSKPSSSVSETIEGGSNLIVNKGHKRKRSVSNDEGLEDGSKKKVKESFESERSDKRCKNRDKVSSDKNIKIVDQTDNTQRSDEESNSGVTDDMDKDKKSGSEKGPEGNPTVGDQSLDESRPSHSFETERKCTPDVEDKDEGGRVLPSGDKPDTTKSSKCKNLFNCIVCKRNYCTNKKQGTRLGNYSKKIAEFCQNCYIDMYKTNYSSLISKLHRKNKS